MHLITIRAACCVLAISGQEPPQSGCIWACVINIYLYQVYRLRNAEENYDYYKVKTNFILSVTGVSVLLLSAKCLICKINNLALSPNVT